MGVRILQGDQPYDGACLYCSTSMWAFGPVFEDAQQAQDFCNWLGDTDPRTFTEKELENQYHDFLDEREEQKAAEKEEQAAEES